MSINIQVESPEALSLQALVHDRIVELGWQSDPDDKALAEYITLMVLSSGRSQEQLAVEVATDLLNSTPEESGSNDFAQWFFDEARRISNGAGSQQDALADMAMSDGMSTNQPNAEQTAESASQTLNQQNDDMDLSNNAPTAAGTMYVSPDLDWPQKGYRLTRLSPPSGPKSMRNGRNPLGRTIGQMNKAMDRSAEGALHKIKGAANSGRINSRSREPPRGPRNAQHQQQRRQGFERSMNNTAPLNTAAMNPMMNTNMNMQNNPFMGMQGMSPQQQMEMMAIFAEQARLAAEQFAGVNSFQQPKPQGYGKSLFERIEKGPKQRSRQQRPRDNAVEEMDLTSSMEVEPSSQSGLPGDAAKTMCKYNLTCTRPDCIFAHQSMAAPAGAQLDMDVTCPFGLSCRNAKCSGKHPSPAGKHAQQVQQDCKFFPNCTNPACPFRHPTPICRNGAGCTVDGCKFAHPTIACKFNPCMNASCPYKHEDGQKRGNFEDKVWTKGHTSERKFVEDEDAEEELIKPMAMDGMDGGSASVKTEEPATDTTQHPTEIVAT